MIKTYTNVIKYCKKYLSLQNLNNVEIQLKNKTSNKNVKFTDKVIKHQDLSKKTNISDNIINLANLTPRHLISKHPISILAVKIKEYFNVHYTKGDGRPIFVYVDNINPIVSTKEAFDDLDFAKNHPSRSFNDSYFMNSDYLLRGWNRSYRTVATQLYFPETVDINVIRLITTSPPGMALLTQTMQFINTKSRYKSYHSNGKVNKQ
ncbi:hypothetical protein A3Q56_01384 [Intoshia linei]|uniref:Uncharacterized protein n=1 Tax=Intoshia linei TaxID=1819745 RepID=A0A177B995_9BILA|nr:hypothetical protein A3Q56_01384 [Intoshia linei]